MMRPEQLGRLIDEHSRALVLFARQWCHTPEDVVQEAFVKLSKQADVPRNVAAWLFRVVRNGAISASRSERRRQRHENEAARHRDAFVGSPTDELDARSVESALETLPLELRELLVAHIWGGLTFEQIGSMTGSSSSTAHRRYLSALSLLRERLQMPCPKT